MDQSFDMFRKDSSYGLISESFAVNLVISIPLSACSNPCVGPLPRIKMPFFLLSILVDELRSTPKIITFLPISLPIEKNSFLSNPIPYPEYYTNQHQHVLLI